MALKHRVLILSFLWIPFWMACDASSSTYGQRAVAAVLMGEARGEGKKGMIAVAEVIAERAERWDISPLAVIKRPRHFSCLNKTTVPGLIRKFRGHRRFDTALKIARTLYNKPHQLPDLTKGATHFATVSSRPYWAEGEAPVVIIGNHAFYKLDL